MELLELHRRFRRYLSNEDGLMMKTVKAMESSFKTFLKRTGVTNVSEIKEGLLRDFFYKGLEIHQWSQSHYSNNHKYLKRFLDWCVKQEFIKSNPILNIKVPKAPKPLPRRLTEEDTKKLIYSSFIMPSVSSFEQIRNFTMIFTLIFSGLRMSELLNLQIMDVNLIEGFFYIRHGKGDKDRKVPVHFKLCTVLQRYMEERGRIGKDSEWFFTGVHRSKRLSPKDLYRISKKLVKESSVVFTPHQLRHTFASRCIEEGMGLVQLKEILGHSNIASTMIYLKISTKNLKESLNKLELF